MPKYEGERRTVEKQRMTVVRVRMLWGVAGGSNYYHHADVLVKDEEEALEAAREGRITNWRWIDTYDSTSESYKEFELIGRISRSGARNVRRPIAAEPRMSSGTRRTN